MTVISDIFTKLTEVVQGFIGIIQALFADDGLIAVFYDSVTGLTFVGGLLLLVFGYGLVRWAFSYIKRLIQLRG